MCVGAGHPPGRPQLGDRDLPLPREVRGDPDRLPDGGDTGCVGPGRVGVREGSLGIVVDQPSSGDEVPGDGVRGLLRQRSQLTPDLPVQVARIDVLGYLKALLRATAQLTISRSWPRLPGRLTSWRTSAP
jgi:hypothetical protein